MLLISQRRLLTVLWLFFAILYGNHLLAQRWLTCAKPSEWGNTYGKIPCANYIYPPNPVLKSKYDAMGNRVFVDYGKMDITLVESEENTQIQNQADLKDNDEETINSNAINIFPNPTSERINISAEKMNPNSSYTLYDATGKLIIQQNATTENFMEVGHLPQGNYFLVLRSDKRILHKWKIVKK